MDATRVTLLERAARGGQDAWTELDHLYRPFINGWFRGQGVADDADDLTQEIMTALIQEVPRFEHNRRVGAFRSWLRTVCLHRLLNHRRSRFRRGMAIGGTEFLQQIQEVAAPQEPSEAEWNLEHDRAVLRHLFAKFETEFDPKTLSAFRQLALLERPAPEVAAELGMTVGAIYVAKSRVLRRLREEAGELLDRGELPSTEG